MGILYWGSGRASDLDAGLSGRTPCLDADNQPGKGRGGVRMQVIVALCYDFTMTTDEAV